MSSRMIKSSSPFFLAWIFFVGIQSCDSQKPVDREAVIKEMGQRELKRISDAELLQTAQKIGDTLTLQAQSLLKTNLMKALEEGGVPRAIQFCNLNAGQILQSMDIPEGIQIERATDKSRNTQNQADSLESLIFEAYAFNYSEGLPLSSSVIEENKEVLIYTSPITIAGGLCLNCHGEIGSEIKEIDYDSILSYYPNDKAIGYKLNELRGMWVIRMPKKAIINEI